MASYLKASGADTLSFITDVSTSSFGTLADTSLEVDLLDRLDSDDLWELRKQFGIEEPTSTLSTTFANQPLYCGLPLTKQEFVESITKVIGSPAYTHSAEELFDHLSADNVAEYRHVIWWEQVLDCIMERMARQNVEETEWKPVPEDQVQIHTMTFCKREVIVKVVQMEATSTFCYTMISKFGHAGVYDGRLNLLLTYQIPLGVGGGQEESKKATSWVTDAVYLPDALYLCVAASNRSLHFYDVSGIDHAPTFLVSGFPDCPEVLKYCVGSPSKLFIGDDHGDITIMNFKHPTWSLFARQNSVSSNLYFWKELSEQAEFVTIKVDEKVHESEVGHLMYFSATTSLLSCSRDATSSLVSRRLDQCRGPYVFNIPRGVRCFHMDRDLQVLVTGSADAIVRLWNPVVTKCPMTSLFGHKYAVEDVRILKSRNIVLSVALDGELRVWDIEDHYCMQTVQLKFSFTNRLGEFGKQCIYPGPLQAVPPDLRQPKSPSSTASTVQNERILSEYTSLREKYENNEEWNRSHILIACKNQMAMVKLNRRDITEVSPRSIRDPAPPPPYDKPVHVPTLWNKYDTILNVPLIQEPGQNLARTWPVSIDRPCDTILNVPLIQEPGQESRLEGSDSFEEGMMGSTMPRLTFPMNSLRIHTRRATQNINLEEMSKLVDQCAPHLAINLMDLGKLSTSLPVIHPTRHQKGTNLTPVTPTSERPKSVRTPTSDTKGKIASPAGTKVKIASPAGTKTSPSSHTKVKLAGLSDTKLKPASPVADAKLKLAGPGSKSHVKREGSAPRDRSKKKL
ncbi:hypothetical protein M8J75_013029 [Diaphorina citri]|nr:hypothetical protein M8J75_013029 [Diaphorina citri]